MKTGPPRGLSAGPRRPQNAGLRCVSSMSLRQKSLEEPHVMCYGKSTSENALNLGVQQGKNPANYIVGLFFSGGLTQSLH